MPESEDHLKSRDTLKSYFETEDIPTEDHFKYLINSLRHYSDGELIKDTVTDENGITTIILSDDSQITITPPPTDDFVPKTGGAFSGNIGIGTTGTPAAKLEVSGPYDGSNSQVIINTTGSNAELRLSDNGVPKGFAWFNKLDDKVAFGRGGSASSLFITNDNKFGFGTNDPQQKAHFSGGIVRVQNGEWHGDIGSRNADWFHFETNRPKFWFNKGLQTQGNLGLYQKSTYMRHSDGFIFENNKRVATQEYVGGLFSAAFLGSGATTKARDSDKLDGLDSAAFLRADTNDSINGQIAVASTNKRTAGIYGNYDSHRTAHIWSMGTNYKVHESGTNFGNLYGLAYKHTNNPTGGNMAGGHQAVWCDNGAPQVAIGHNIWTKGNVYANGVGYFGDGKQIIKFDDNWLRLNPSGGFNSGIYCDGDRLRTDGQFEVGPDGAYFKVTTDGVVSTGSSIVSGNHIYGKKVNNEYSNLYRFGGIYFTWDSDSYGDNTHHSIRSTYGDTYGDSITMNSFNNIRLNIDSNNNNANAKFEIGRNTTGQSNVIFSVDENGTTKSSGDIYESGTKLSNKYLNINGIAQNANSLEGFSSSDFIKITGGEIYGDLTVNGELKATNGIYAEEPYYGNNKELMRFNDNWLRLNPGGDFEGVNCGSGILQTDGDFHMGYNGINFKVSYNGEVTAAGNITAFSDRRLKTNIQPVTDNFLGKISQLKPSYYNWKDETKDQEKQLGFIAQEVQGLFPEWVHQSGEHLSMSYDKMGAVLAVKGIQELHQEIKVLKEELKLMKDGVTN